MHDVFIVISEGADGEHIARTVFAAGEDDARQTHQENYADELIVAVHQDDHRPRQRLGPKSLKLKDTGAGGAGGPGGND